MSARAVFFDFSGTLFRLEQDESWFAGVTDSGGAPLDAEAQAELMRRMTAPVGPVVGVDAEHQHAWENRDLDPELHRKIYREFLRRSGVAVADQVDALYGRLVDPGSWTPYPDTAEVLRRLHSTGVRIAVISNIAFDIRPAFERLGVAGLVDEFVLSYLEGVIKPDPKIFLRAAERLGVEPGDALMIGDHEDVDGAAAAVGCRVAIVDPAPTSERPDALLTAVAEHGF
ncbi:HAD-IA family hydrolase [Saccharopolyspora erythraea]|uniref:HAD family hydrolase n=1 Tax=Saccharopolyspora erythraea TaxID=1836 RepID=UPI001BA6E664|nr:HAD-IA family hydrolase [Saccharopolyspora erythraea]QUG99789.1 HAD-IA family hydrolase [Saccharopolyspora erythraea]